MLKRSLNISKKRRYAWAAMVLLLWKGFNMQKKIFDFQIRCNVLLIGKSGSGKSSFANYLFGVDTFTTGAGKPVTKWEENFQHYQLLQDSIEINVYDSVGLEPNTFKTWQKKLEEFLLNTQGTLANSLVCSANNIMHVLFYVINAASARIENSEIQLVNRIQNKYKLSSVFILTNCDTATIQQIEAAESEIKKYSDKVEIIRVCSVQKKKRNGSSIKPFGKDDAVIKILTASYEKIGKDLVYGVCNDAIDKLENMKPYLHQKIDNMPMVGAFSSRAIKAAINTVDLELTRVFYESKWIPLSYENYHAFINNFPNKWRGKDVFNKTFDTIIKLFDNCMNQGLSIERLITNACDIFEDGNIFEKIAAISEIAPKLLFIKMTLKENIDKQIDSLILILRDQQSSL